MKPFINVLLLSRTLCFLARYTYAPFPKMAPLRSKFFRLLKDLLNIIISISFILFFERVPELLLLENEFQNPTLLRKSSIKACYLSTMFYIIQVRYNYRDITFTKDTVF